MLIGVAASPDNKHAGTNTYINEIDVGSEQQTCTTTGKFVKSACCSFGSSKHLILTGQNLLTITAALPLKDT